MKYQKYQKYKITIGTKWELYKTKSFGSKSKGGEGGGGGGGGGGVCISLCIMNFAIIEKFRYDSKFSLS